MSLVRLPRLNRQWREYLVLFTMVITIIIVGVGFCANLPELPDSSSLGERAAEVAISNAEAQLPPGSIWQVNPDDHFRHH